MLAGVVEAWARAAALAASERRRNAERLRFARSTFQGPRRWFAAWKEAVLRSGAEQRSESQRAVKLEFLRKRARAAGLVRADPAFEGVLRVLGVLGSSH